MLTCEGAVVLTCEGAVVLTCEGAVVLTYEGAVVAVVPVRGDAFPLEIFQIRGDPFCGALLVLLAGAVPLLWILLTESLDIVCSTF